MTQLEKLINDLTWFNLVEKLKQILKAVLAKFTAVEKPYKIYEAMLTQSGTNPPVGVVLNPLNEATITYRYVGQGLYKIVSDVAIFTEGKVVLIQGAGNSSNLVALWCYYDSPTELFLEVYDIGNTNITIPTENDLLNNQYIELRVYPI